MAAMPDVPIYKLDRQKFHDDPSFFVDEAFPDVAREPNTPVVLIDIGGYFAESSSPDHVGPILIAEALSQRGYALAGIVEDTQNGHHRYDNAIRLAAGKKMPPVYSVAHSPLKSPENHLVGVAVTFSIEAILRQSNVVLQSRRAGVIGFGPIGRSVAHALRNRGVPVRVCEVDPIRLAQAAAQGFHVHDYDEDFISFADDLNLIVSATGAGAHVVRSQPAPAIVHPDEVMKPRRLGARTRLALNVDTIRYVEAGAYVASVTSADDEIDLVDIGRLYASDVVPYNEDVSIWTEQGQESDAASLRPAHSFYLLLGGNAVNFRHDGVIGPAIQLLQGEILSCVQSLLEALSAEDEVGRGSAQVLELGVEERREVANAWLDQYLVENMLRG